MIYTINVLFVCLWGVLSNLKKSKLANRFFLLLCGIQFTLLIGLRDNTGADFKAYNDIYMSLHRLKMAHIFSNFYIKEPLFVLLCKVLQFFFGSNYYSLHFFMGMLTVFFLLLAIDKFSKHVFMSLYLYLSFCLLYVCMNQERQMLAISIVLYAYTFLKNGEVNKYVFWIIIAALFHNSAIIMLPVYFIIKRSYKKRTLFCYIGITFLLIFLLNIALNNLMTLPYGFYLVQKMNNAFVISSILNTIYRGFLFIIVLLFSSKLIIYDKNNQYLLHLASICMTMQVLVLFNNGMARITTYFYVFYIFLIPQIVDVIKDKRKKILMQFMLLIVFSIVHVLYFNLYYTNGLDYHFVKF